MELTVSMLISIISIVLAVTTFVSNRKDKATKDVKEEQQQFDKHHLIEYRLDELTKKVDKILDKLEKYDAEIKVVVKEEIKNHINQYHKKGGLRDEF